MLRCLTFLSISLFVSIQSFYKIVKTFLLQKIFYFWIFFFFYNNDVIQKTKINKNTCNRALTTIIVLLYSSPIAVPFSYTHVFISPKMYHSLFGMFIVVNFLTMFLENLIDLDGGLSINPTIIDFVFGRRSAVKIFSISYANVLLLLFWCLTPWMHLYVLCK